MMRIHTYVPKTGNLSELLRCTPKPERPAVVRALLQTAKEHPQIIQLQRLREHIKTMQDPDREKLILDLPLTHVFVKMTQPFNASIRAYLVADFIGFGGAFSAPGPGISNASTTYRSQHQEPAYLVVEQESDTKVDEDFDESALLASYEQALSQKQRRESK
jgi:hypothetical protein